MSYLIVNVPQRDSYNEDGSLCSGYKVFPGGVKCKGCIDCDFGKSTDTIEQAFNKNHLLITVSKKKKNEK